MKGFLFLLFLLMSNSLSAQLFVIAWPIEAGDYQAEQVEHMNEGWISMGVENRSKHRFRPIGADMAFTFQVFCTSDTSSFLQKFPVQPKSRTAFVLEQVKMWNLEELAQKLKDTYGRKWRSRKCFTQVMQGLLDESFVLNGNEGDWVNSYDYKGAPITILWDEPQRSEYEKVYERHNLVHTDYIFDYSLDGAKWIVLGREPLHQNNVLLLLTKNIHVLTGK